MYEYKIKDLVKVVDGDTIDVVIDLGFDVFTKKRIRVFGINTPETRTRDKKEKQLGIKAKERVKDLLENSNEIKIKSHGKGKFGRIIAEILFAKNKKSKFQNLSEILVSEGHAKEYFGGKR